VGPVFGMTFGAGQETRTFVGAAGGSTMRQRILEIVYEVTVRFDDGRFGLLELTDASGFRVGDRVRVVDNQLELLPRE
jgi:outer membrane lipoprotein SlyB